MRIPKSEFTDADLKLCRAHGASVAHGRVMTASQPHDDAEWSRRWERAEAIAAFETEICMPADLPLPPSYSEDLEQWLAQRESERVHEAVLDRQSAARSVAPAKPAAGQPAKPQDASGWRIGSDVPPHERVGLWHYKAVGGKLASVARQGDDLMFDVLLYRQAAPGTKEGDRYDESKYATADMTARLASTSSADGAALVGAKLTHSVCIKAHHGVQVGRVVDGSRPLAYPKLWLPCDAAGWIPHTPTADSVCPVPDGVRFEARYGDGTPVDDTESTKHGDCIILWRATTGSVPCNDIVAWRPIAKDAS